LNSIQLIRSISRVDTTSGVWLNAEFAMIRMKQTRMIRNIAILSAKNWELKT